MMGTEAKESGRGGGTALRRAWEWTKLGATALLLLLVLRTFVVEAFRIPTGSMADTLLPGDFLLVSKVAYGARLPGTGWHLPALRRPEVGDVVVFRPPASAGRRGATRYVKRVVAGPGDTVAMRSGALVRNGSPVEEPYARKDTGGNTVHDPRFRWQEEHLVGDGEDGGTYRPTPRDWGPLRVPDGTLFVLGDNRAASEDSRHWGFVPLRSVTGETLFVYYSRHPDGRGPEGVRWRRIFSAVR